MIIPDVNLLIYACDVDAEEEHAPAQQWWADLLTGPKKSGLPG